MSIYQQFDKATANFTAAALILNGKVAGRVVIKYGAAATAYVQVWGVEMASGRATGYGYDKATAAVDAAVAKLRLVKAPEHDVEAQAALAALLSAFNTRDDGTRYTSRLEAAGFTLANVI